LAFNVTFKVRTLTDMDRSELHAYLVRPTFVSTSQSNTIYGLALSSRHLYCFVMACNLQKSSL